MPTAVQLQLDRHGAKAPRDDGSELPAGFGMTYARIDKGLLGRVFRTPLYEPYQIDTVSAFAEQVLVSSLTVDGHCPDCSRTSTFQSYHGPCGQIFHDVIGRQSVSGNSTWDSFKNGKTSVLFGLQRDLICARN